MTLAIVILIVFAVLIFLKFCEGSPVRSWKAVFLIGAPLAFGIFYYWNHAFPHSVSHQTHAQRLAVNRAELQRNFNHIAGVKSANIVSNEISLDYAANQPLTVFRENARNAAGTLAYALGFTKTNHIIVQVAVNEQRRYTFTYQPAVGIVDETGF